MNAINKVVSTFLDNEVLVEKWMCTDTQKSLLNALGGVIQKCQETAASFPSLQTENTVQSQSVEKTKKSKSNPITKPKKTNAYIEFCKEQKPILKDQKMLIEKWNAVKKTSEYKKYAELAKAFNEALSDVDEPVNTVAPVIVEQVQPTNEQSKQDATVDKKTIESLDKLFTNSSTEDKPVFALLNIKKTEEQIKAWEIFSKKYPLSTVFVHNSKGIAIKSSEFTPEITRKIEKKIKKAKGVVYEASNDDEIFICKLTITQVLEILESIAYDETNTLIRFKDIILITSQINKNADMFKTNKWMATKTISKVKVSQ